MENIDSPYVFHAQYFDIIKEDDIYIFGIADDENDPLNYLIIQFASSVDDQDMESGSDKEYFESSFVDGGHYGVVKNIAIYENKIIIVIQDENESRTLVCDTTKCINNADYIYNALINIKNKVNSKIEIKRFVKTI